MNAYPRHLRRTRYQRITLSFYLAAIWLLNGLSTLADSSSFTSPNEADAAVSRKSITDLKFSEFFLNPVGPTGLQLTDKLKDLKGRRVRILGYMVRRENKIPGTFLLTAIPVQLHEDHYGLGDDLPAATLVVTDPVNRDNVIQHTAGLIVLSGILDVGNREESDGRISVVRLTLDSPAVQLTKERPSEKESRKND
jgi:hypothetical protein